LSQCLEDTCDLVPSEKCSAKNTANNNIHIQFFETKRNYYVMTIRGLTSTVVFSSAVGSCGLINGIHFGIIKVEKVRFE
jgi:threonine synthase